MYCIIQIKKNRKDLINFNFKKSQSVPMFPFFVGALEKELSLKISVEIKALTNMLY